MANNHQGKGRPLYQARKNVHEGAIADGPDHSLGKTSLFHHNSQALLGWKNSGGRSKETGPLGFMARQRGGSGHVWIPVTHRWGPGQAGGLVVCVFSRVSASP